MGLSASELTFETALSPKRSVQSARLVDQLWETQCQVRAAPHRSRPECLRLVHVIGDGVRSGCYIGHLAMGCLWGARGCRTGVERRIAGKAVYVEIGRRGERHRAAARTEFAILALTEYLREHNSAQAFRYWMDDITSACQKIDIYLNPKNKWRFKIAKNLHVR